jgi:hypothetical protein
MEGREIDKIANFGHNLVGNKNRLGEHFTAMDDPMADGMNLGFVLDDAMIWGKEDCDYVFDGDNMIKDLGGDFDFGAVEWFVRDDGTGHTDTGYHPFGHDEFFFHVKELVLNR